MANDQYRKAIVSTLAVEWIEILCSLQHHRYYLVSTLAVEWIEIL